MPLWGDIIRNEIQKKSFIFLNASRLAYILFELICHIKFAMSLVCHQTIYDKESIYNLSNANKELIMANIRNGPRH